MRRDIAIFAEGMIMILLFAGVGLASAAMVTVNENGEHTIALEGSGSSLVESEQFSEPIKIGESWLSDMAVYSNSIYVVFGEYMGGEYPLMFRRSDDDGITWSTPVSIIRLQMLKM